MGEIERLLNAEEASDDAPVADEPEAAPEADETKFYDADTSRPEYDPEAEDDDADEDEDAGEEPDEDEDEEPALGDPNLLDGEKEVEAPDTLTVTSEDGQDVQVSHQDLEKAWKTAQKVARFQSEAAATLQKANDKEMEIRNILQRLTIEPAETLEEIFSGVSGSEVQGRAQLIDMATKILAAHIEEESNPNKREERLLLKERKKLDQESNRREHQQKFEAQEALTTKLHEEAVAGMKAAGFADIEADPEAYGEVYVKIMDLRATAIEADNPLTAAQAALQVKESRAKSLAQLLKSTPTKELLEKFPEHAKKIQKLRVASAKAKKAGAKRPRRATASQAAAKQDGEGEVFSHTRDFLDSLRSGA